MDQENFDNVLYRYAFLSLSDLMDHIKEIQQELEDLYLDIQDLTDSGNSDPAAARALLEQRLQMLQARRWGEASPPPPNRETP